MLRSLVAIASVVLVNAQDSTSATSASSTSITSAVTASGITVSLPGSINTNASVAIPTGSYQIITGSQISAATTLGSSRSNNGTLSSTSNPYQLVGSATTSGNATVTASTATPTNTQPCNGYPEFCGRKYSNITEVAAHNAAFVKKNNAFSNQEIGVVGQLNDGIRMIQGEVHFENNTLYNCHSNCNFLNTGPYVDTLRTIRSWIEAHPYDVVTILIVNSNFANVTNFASAFEAAGLVDYMYLPSQRPMRLDDWPTLEDMILSNSRVVAFMDYQADADLVPYILDEFSNMWETPFSPTDTAFPCTQQRPPNLPRAQARNDYLYMANHNLNVELSLGGSNILIPNFAELALVNANNNSIPSLKSMAERCTRQWDRPPNFLLVDFYDVSAPTPGAVFEVAAAMNNVTYTGRCCGKVQSLTSGAMMPVRTEWPLMSLMAAIAFGALAFAL